MRTGSSVRSTASFLVAAAGLGFGLLVFFLVLGILGALDDADAHFVERGHDVLDLVGGHLIRRQGLVQLIDGDDSALLGAGDQLLDRRVVEVDQRGIARVGRVEFLCFVFRHKPLSSLADA
jgi:hypothetical protein